MFTNTIVFDSFTVLQQACFISRGSDDFNTVYSSSWYLEERSPPNNYEKNKIQLKRD